MNRRVVVVGATCAVVLAATGIAFATSAGTGDRQLQVVDKRVSASPTDETPTTHSTATTAPELTTTTAFATDDTNPEVIDTTTTTAAVDAPLAEAADLQGTITIASTIVAEEEAPVTVTLRNIADHPVSLWSPSDYMHYAGFALEGNASVTGGIAADIDANQVTLAAGEQRSFSGGVTPKPESVGDATVSAAMLWSTYFGPREPNVSYHFTGVPSIPVLVVPPGFAPDGPLAASLGNWRAEVSSDAKTVAVGDTFVIHAVLTNVGNRPQSTGGYGAIAIGCDDRPYTFVDSHFVGATTITPGDSKAFDFEFVAFASEQEMCSAGVLFGDNTFDVAPRQDFQTNVVTIPILPLGTTATSRPATTTMP